MDSWTLWSEQQPTDAKLVYRWRIPAQEILGPDRRCPPDRLRAYPRTGDSGTGHAAGVVGETLFSPMPT